MGPWIPASRPSIIPPVRHQLTIFRDRTTESRDFKALVSEIATLKKAGAKGIRFLSLAASSDGLQRMLDAHPDVPVHAAAMDRELNEAGYILPGLGDAGDRLCGLR